MKCPNCVLGDLQFFIRGELRFRTDDRGRPCGTADVRTDDERCWIRCDTCSAEFGVRGFENDGSGEVILVELESHAEDGSIELEPKSPPPGGLGMD